MEFTQHIYEIKDCNIYILTVRTPIDKTQTTDLTPLLETSEKAQKVLKRNDIVIYDQQFILVALKKIVSLFWENFQN